MTVPQVLNLIHEQLSALEKEYAKIMNKGHPCSPKLTVLDAQITTLRELQMDIEEIYDAN